MFFGIEKSFSGIIAVVKSMGLITVWAIGEEEALKKSRHAIAKGIYIVSLLQLIYGLIIYIKTKRAPQSKILLSIVV